MREEDEKGLRGTGVPSLVNKTSIRQCIGSRLLHWGKEAATIFEPQAGVTKTILLLCEAKTIIRNEAIFIPGRVTVSDAISRVQSIRQKAAELAGERKTKPLATLGWILRCHELTISGSCWCLLEKVSQM